MEQRQKNPFLLKHEAVNNVYADEVAYSADWLIRQFGQAAYWRGVAMAISALKNGDKEMCRALGKANVELIKRGFNMLPQKGKDS